ncbi:hypothetical protein Hanom_Chr09g00778621 [Helianthus anomalus]
MGVRPLQDEKELLYEQIHENFMYPSTGVFAAPHTATEGAHILNPRPRRATTPAGEDVVLLFQRGVYSFFRTWATIAGGSHPKKVEVSVVESGAASHRGTDHSQQLSLDDFLIVADSMEKFYSIGGKFKTSVAADVRSSSSVSSKDQPSGATLMSTPVEKMEANPILELTLKHASKNQREESKLSLLPVVKKVIFHKPIIGKKADLGSLMSGISSGKRFITFYL